MKRWRGSGARARMRTGARPPALYRGRCRRLGKAPPGTTEAGIGRSLRNRCEPMDVMDGAVVQARLVAVRYRMAKAPALTWSERWVINAPGGEVRPAGRLG